MTWNEVWPYDPAPKTEVENPYLVNVNSKRGYWWCACGQSKNQPWCDGCGHKGTGMKPILYQPDLAGRKILCGCKVTERPPYCDASCSWLRAHKRPRIYALGCFAFCFAGGLFSSWLIHP
eukprot:Platyproteum_vivax@DN17514_c0_g1_i1.p1